MARTDKSSNNYSQKYQDQYSEKKFWNKLKLHARNAGQNVVETALELFYALQDSDTPAWAKSVIVGALAYFIVPTDLIPDFLPAGYFDDFGTLLAALKVLSNNIKLEHEEKAREKSAQWFGDAASDGKPSGQG